MLPVEDVGSETESLDEDALITPRQVAFRFASRTPD